MKRLLCLLIFVLLITTGCGDNDSSEDNQTSTGFTTDMLDDATYYLSYVKNDETVQSTVIFSGNSATVTDDWYDADGVFQFRGTYTVDITLNDDGTITASSASYEGSDTLTQTSESAAYSVVEWTYDSDRWIDNWYTEKPDDWYATAAFTTVQIDDDTYYVSYAEDSLTIQETITFSGDASNGYSATVIQDTYDTDGALQSTATTVHEMTLGEDGTLTSTTDTGTVTFTLLSSTEDNLMVLGADDEYAYTGTDCWYFSQPDGWL